MMYVLPYIMMYMYVLPYIMMYVCTLQVRSVEDRDVLIELESGGIIGKATTHTATGTCIYVCI